MPPLEKQTFGQGDVKDFPKAQVVTNIHSNFRISKLTVQPGWKWSECIKPLAGTDSCQVAHCGVVTEGSMCVKMEDGTEQTFNAGDSFYIPPGHDGWVVGDTPMVGYEFATRSENVWNTDKKE
ncbi:hypothetical protein HOP50_01g10000 [Chloropicon primus]|uniref:Cupin n=1 Tax=Chloropicon primus TaxID=1764295 RepID=A0A5B8MD73_9CHLO|nr:hypothetical protein A3770_01p10140 [Chloropicon primus]UPQ97705.1 hypothetical protein HOP50_01g10000 [Chloropicon primus]|eukprot:QDZ18496.1 hypothetical protein A3770_01p10140 [Chloropicon primus]